MLVHPWRPPTAPPDSPTRRLSAALVASAIAHALLTTALAPGTGRGESAPTSLPTSLAARLVMEEPQPPVAEPAIERESVPARSAARERRKVAPPQAAPSSPTAGQGAGVDIPDSTYYGVRQLDVFPSLAGAFELRYPPRAAAGAVKGRVTLLVLIDAHGTVNDVSVVVAEPAGYFEEDALRALRSTRFKPAQKDGRPVKSRLVIEVNYGDS